MAKAKTLKDLFHDTLKDIYFAEKKIMSALPKMAKAAQSDDLRAAFEKHLEETEGQVERLESVFEKLGETTRGKTCDAIMGILDEGTCLSTKAPLPWMPAYSLPLKPLSIMKSLATERSSLGQTNSA